jgi:hypothetical protein
MKHSTIAKIFAFAAVSAIALSTAPAAKAENRGCTNASVLGTFAYTSTGYIVAAPLPPWWGRPPRSVRNNSTGMVALPLLSIRA